MDRLSRVISIKKMLEQIEEMSKQDKSLNGFTDKIEEAGKLLRRIEEQIRRCRLTRKEEIELMKKMYEKACTYYKIEELKEKGMNYSQIARKLGVSRKTIWNIRMYSEEKDFKNVLGKKRVLEIAKRLGVNYEEEKEIKSIDVRVQRMKDRYVKIDELRKKGYSWSDIADKLEVCKKTVENTWRRGNKEGWDEELGLCDGIFKHKEYDYMQMVSDIRNKHKKQ